jgi:hypothetical protein
MTITYHSSFLAIAAIGFAVIGQAHTAESALGADTLDLDVTFIGDREVFLQDAHKQLHWPEAANMGNEKPSFAYPVIPKMLNVEPVWTRNGPVRLKINDPLPRLYKGYVNAGMGNYLSPLLHVSYSDVRSRSKSWGVQFKHESTDGGFADNDSIEQGFSSNHLGGFYRKFWNDEALTFGSSYQRENISLYGGLRSTNQDSALVIAGDDYHYQVFSNSLHLANRHAKSASWQHEIGLNHSFLWASNLAQEHNFDLSIGLSGFVDTIPIHFDVHMNIDRLNRLEEGSPAINERQAIFDIHPSIRKTFGPIKTAFGFGLWIDAQGNQPFLFAPELDASVSLLRDLFIPYIRIDGGVRQNRYQTALKTNPFVSMPTRGLLDSSKVWHNTYETIHAVLGMRGSITRSFSFNINAAFKRNNQHLFWVQEDAFSDGRTFTPFYQDLSITTLHGDVTWKLGEATELQAEMNQHTYRLRDSLTNNSQAWFLPQLELAATASHTIKDKLRLQANLSMLAGRKGLTTTAPENDLSAPIALQSNNALVGFAQDLSNITLINFQAEYLYNARLSGWLHVNNLLNQANPYFSGYASQNIRFQLGASIAF